MHVVNDVDPHEADKLTTALLQRDAGAIHRALAHAGESRSQLAAAAVTPITKPELAAIERWLADAEATADSPNPALGFVRIAAQREIDARAIQKQQTTPHHTTP